MVQGESERSLESKTARLSLCCGATPPSMQPGRREASSPCTIGFPFGNPKNESVHLAPTLLRESWGDLTVRGGLRAVSQRLI